MARVVVLGGYGAVGQRVARTLVVDATDPVAVRAAAQRVEAVVDCSGRESVDLAESVLAGGAHLVDISANYVYQQAVTERMNAAGEISHEAVHTVGARQATRALRRARQQGWHRVGLLGAIDHLGP